MMKACSRQSDATVPSSWGSMLASLRCGAKTRKGTSCRSPAVAGKKRCRMHCGAVGSGAPKGNNNALKHGRYSKDAIAARRNLRDLIKQAQKLLEEMG